MGALKMGSTEQMNVFEQRLNKHQEVINNQGAALQQIGQTGDQLNLKMSQQGQILEQYRVNIYNLELRFNLLAKMLEEKGLFSQGEYEKRWPIFLKNDVGVPGPDGVMEGSLRVTFYEAE